MVKQLSQKQKLISVLNWKEHKAEVTYLAQFIDSQKSQEIFDALKQEINWKQEYIKLFGKSIKEPRLVAWYSDFNYSYSGKLLEKQSIKSLAILDELVKEISSRTNQKFNAVLCNYYRNGNDSMSWHSDDEMELGADPIIASLSFGFSRKFKLRSKFDKNQTIDLKLEPGSLLLMGKGSQQFWKHALPKTKQDGERINLTFRLIV